VKNGVKLDEAGKKRLSQIDVLLAQKTLTFSQNVVDATTAFTHHVEDVAELAGCAGGRRRAHGRGRAREGPHGLPRHAARAGLRPDPHVRREPRPPRAPLPRERHARAREPRALPRDFGAAPREGHAARVPRFRRARALGPHGQDGREGPRLRRRSPRAPPARVRARERGARGLRARDVRRRRAPARPVGRRLLRGAPAQEALRLRRRGPPPVLPARPRHGGALRDRDRALYGVTIAPWTNDEPGGGPRPWHADVLSYVVRDGDGTRIGAFYVDLFPRAEKRDGAWMGGHARQAPGHAARGRERGRHRRQHDPARPRQEGGAPHAPRGADGLPRDGAPPPPRALHGEGAWPRRHARARRFRRAARA
jgi:oligopeptidase A